MDIDSVFKRKHKSKSRLLTVQQIYGLRKTKGEVGLEVEVEGFNLPSEEYMPDKIPLSWAYHHDGSLRGEENAEYVLAKPVPFDDVGKVVDELFGMFAGCHSQLDDSNRTSLHVHLNVQDFRLNRLCAFMCLYIIVEELLTRSCGEHREGNLFCLSTKDAPGIISTLKQFYKTDGADGMFPSGFHYSGMNALSLGKFGSLEFRTMRGPRRKEDITEWVGILRRLYDLSAEYLDPRDVVTSYSGRGSWGFLADLLGPYFNKIVNGLSSEVVDRSVLQGVRRAQAVSFCRDWSDYVEVIRPERDDPFGRDLSEKVLYHVDLETTAPDQAVVSPSLTAYLVDLESSLDNHGEYYDENQNISVPSVQ